MFSISVMSGLVKSGTCAAESQSNAYYSEQDAAEIVYEEVQCENDHNWDRLVNLWSLENRRQLANFLKDNIENKSGEGLLSIIAANIAEIKELPLEVAKAYINTANYEQKYSEVRVFYVGIDYQVTKETKYYFNGVNYRLAVVVSDGSRRYLAELSDAPVENIVPDGYGFGGPNHDSYRFKDPGFSDYRFWSTNEEIAREIVEVRHKGLIINAKGDVLEDFGDFRRERALSANEHVRPATIQVYLTSSTNYKYYGYKKQAVHAVDFYYYVKNVLPNEWLTSWPAESLKAGAMAVKMYGWYHVYHPKWPSLGADVKDTTSDQVFKVQSEKTKTTEAINAVGAVGMEKADSHGLFEAQYQAGSFNKSGKGSGKMSQNGTNYLAKPPSSEKVIKPMTYDQICHYYYDYSSNTSSEAIAFFKY